MRQRSFHVAHTISIGDCLRTRTGETAMTDGYLPSLPRRKLLAGFGTAGISGAALSLVGHAASARAQESRSDDVVPSVCVFDLNGTLVDTRGAAPLYHRLFGDKSSVNEWFELLILFSEDVTLSGHYTDFFTLGEGVLKMLASAHNVSIQQTDIDEWRKAMLTWPAYPDVPAGLKQLKDAGFRLVTLTNSPPDAQVKQLKYAGIDGWFEKSISVEQVRRFKPAPQTYHLAAEELHVPLAAICMVAAHSFDTIGAQSAGCSGALITRPGVALSSPLPVDGLPQPQVVAPDLPGVATQMIKLWRS
jgi:2-haloacid dehalogenase